MPTFQGSGFSIELPEATHDVSSYGFVFPDLGDFSPSLTVRFEKAKDAPNLSAYAQEKTLPLAESLENFEVVSQSEHARGNWSYLVSTVEWGADDGRLRQKTIYIYVSGEKPAIYTITATDLASNADNSDAELNKIIGSFRTNGEQFF